jgi:hypothetical protein
VREGGARRGHGARILASICPSSYLFGADKSVLIYLTSDYLPINRSGQLMRRIGGIRIGHPPNSD